MGSTKQQRSKLLTLYSSSKYEDVIKLAVSITKKFPEDQFAWKALGVSFTQLGQYDKALNAYSKASSLSPSDAESHNNLGVTFIELGRYDEAEKSLKRAIALRPGYAEAHFNMGNLYAKTNRRKAAEGSYRRAIAVKPDYSMAYCNLGVVLHDCGSFAQAETFYQRAIALKPDYFEAYCNLGITLQEMGRPSEAEACHLKALSIEPNYAQAWANLAITLTELGRLNEAEKVCRQAVALDPNLIEAHNSLGNILEEQDKVPEAIECYSQAIMLRSNFVPALMNRWQLLFDAGDFDAALSDVDRCQTGTARACSLETLYKLGRIEEIYERIELFSPTDEHNIRMAAFSSFVSWLKEKHTAHKFCRDPLSFVYVSNISTHMAENSHFISELLGDLSKTQTSWEPRKKSTVNGYQTQQHINLFAGKGDKVALLKSIILTELDLYRAKYSGESCSYIEKWPHTKDLFGWQVVLKKGGYQTTHIHPAGWVSGVIYLQVVQSPRKSEGAIEFSLNSRNYSHPKAPKLLHQPKLGDIVLFPSSLHHRTIPFTTDTDRIVISFDLRPEITVRDSEVVRAT